MIAWLKVYKINETIEKKNYRPPMALIFYDYEKRHLFSPSFKTLC